MATKVLEIELNKFSNNFDDFSTYDQAFILIRLHGKPIGQLFLPITNGRINQLELQSKILDSPGWKLWDSWLRNSYLKYDERVDITVELPKATIAVCTRDRPEDLKRCLDGLVKLPDLGQEILIIDNCPSTDATQRIVAQYDNIRHVLEEKPGLNVARNRALKEASHEIVAFTDDDAVPDPGWLAALLKNFKDSRVSSVTGLILPLELETKAQEEFERCSPMGKGYHRRVFDINENPPLSAGNIGAGANMALRRSIIELVGDFDEALDCGTPTKSGGDHEMFDRILSAGYQIIYEPEALCWHRHRRDWESLRKTYYGYGVGVYAGWTRSLLIDREIKVFSLALGWFWYDQLPKLLNSFQGKPNSIPLDLLWAELRGCLQGPQAYFVSRRYYDNYEAS